MREHKYLSVLQGKKKLFLVILIWKSQSRYPTPTILFHLHARSSASPSSSCCISSSSLSNGTGPTPSPASSGEPASSNNIASTVSVLITHPDQYCDTTGPHSLHRPQRVDPRPRNRSSGSICLRAGPPPLSERPRSSTTVSLSQTIHRIEVRARIIKITRCF